MKTLAFFSAAVLCAAVAVPVATGATVPVGSHTPGSIQKGCTGPGDLYAGPGVNGMYGCLKGDGSGVVCGGAGKYAKTCSTFAQAPPHLPTQMELHNAEVKASTTKAKAQ